MYQWALANRAALPAMTLHEVVAAAKAIGVRLHTYCAMD